MPPTATRSVKTEYGALNTLAVELREQSIVAYVNGRPVATAELAAEASGTLGALRGPAGHGGALQPTSASASCCPIR